MDRGKQIYSYDEAYEESLRYFQGDELAARVWVNKYAVKDSFGNIYEKSPEDMHWRIANEVARIEDKVSECTDRQRNCMICWIILSTSFRKEAR